MQATNNDVLGFYFSPPDVQGVRKLTGKAKEDAEAIFSTHNILKPMNTFERGWLYGYIYAGDISVFVAIGRDSKDSRFFQEFRFNGKTSIVGEKLCVSVFEQNKVIIRERGLQVDWAGPFPEFNVSVWLENEGSKAEFRYKFEKINDKVGPYRFVGDILGNRLIYAYVTPCKATLSVKIEGDPAKLGIPAELYDRINGKEITSFFAYNEAVHANTPLYNGGWYWHMLECYQDNPAKPELMFGFMDLFMDGNKPDRDGDATVLSIQFYTIDLETGKIHIDTDAKITRETKDNKPVFTLENDEMTAEIRAQTAPELRKVEGKKVMFGVHLQHMEYSSYQSEGTVKIGDKTYNAVGTSEIAGGKGQRWI
ncbi:MAG: hypothetical protein WC408_05310 [Candidatus Micrarchaeia archaeon]|jgi:hypothetical protein